MLSASMTAFKFPAAALSQHIAIVGKTGSGKTSTGKLAVEQVAGEGARVCVLDPIKSDWWGITSSADGKKPGLPFHILGGPHGHVPLHASAGKAIAELVATGALPLSIIDMALFEPGGHSRFFVDFAQALLRKAKGVVYLVIEEAHFFAPKERSGIGAENMAIHYAKLIATAGRSKGIRMMVLTQRTQALHNALLGSCDTLIAHRFTAPADQAPIVSWLKANVDKEVREQVERSLSSLPTGQGWICSGEAGVFERVSFPRIKTFDNTATPTGEGADRQVATAAIDVERLRAIVGDAVVQAEADDPRILKADVTNLRRKLAIAEKAAAVSVVAKPAPAAGPTEAALRAELATVTHRRDALELVLNSRDAQARKIAAMLLESVGDVALGTKAPDKLAAAVVRQEVRQQNAAPPPRQREAPAAPGPVAAGVTAPQQRILDVLAQLHLFGVAAPNKAMIAAHAGVSPTSGGYFNNLGKLRSLGLIDYPEGGAAALTTAGEQVANHPAKPPTLRELHESWLRIVSNPQAAILEVLIEIYPGSIGKDDLADRVGASRTSGGYFNNLGHLRTLGAIDYPQKGMVQATSILFPKGKPC